MDCGNYDIVEMKNLAKHLYTVKQWQPGVNPERAIFANVEMSFKLCPQIHEAYLKRLKQNPNLCYAQISQNLPSILTEWYRKKFAPGIQIYEDDIVKSPSILQFWHILVQAITKPGDNILFLTPTLGRYIIQGKHLGRNAFEVELEAINGRYEINFQALEESFQNNKITLFVFISPLNPCGRIWSREDVTKIKDLVLKYDSYIFSDEIYSEFLEPKTENGHVYDYFTSILQFEDIYPKLIYGTSITKAFNCSGQGFGLSIVKNKQLQKILKRQLFLAGLLPTAASIHLIETLYTLPEAVKWRNQTNAYLRNNFQVFKKGCMEKIPKIIVYNLECSYLCMVDFKEYGLAGEELKKQFTSIDVCPTFMENAFVHIKPRSTVRINLALNISLIKEIVDRLASMLAKYHSE